MKNRLIIIAVVIGLLISCHDSSNNHPNVKPVDPINPNNKTFIQFDNTQGICTASVYDDYRRREDDIITEISVGNNSVKIEWIPCDFMPFYFSYAVTFKDISGFTLNYVPKIGKDQKTVRIDADKTTIIKVPTLSETFSSPDTLLSKNSYLFIQNNSSFSLELHQGASILKPDNISSPIVNDGEKAKYTISYGSAFNYRLFVSADYKEFSGSIDNFEAGHVYIFDYNGSISLVRDIELKLENVNGFAIPQSPAAPVVITSNESITLQWTAVESTTAYEVWMSTVNDSSSASKYGADVAASLFTTINGLKNGTTYYFWLKAKNNLGTSGFSSVASGTPTASTVKPPDPQTAPSIIAGNGQLTVSWQAVADTSVYEVWTGTTNNAQTATKRGGDISGLSTIITGLNNGTTYYVWIKAKNNIGVSGFSPFTNGKPLGTPGTPTVSSAYKGLLVTWTAVAGSDEYEVYYGIDTPTTLAETTTGTTATISGLTAGTTYNVRLRAKNANGVSEYGLIANGVPNNNPSPGLYRNSEKIGTYNLTASLAYISSNAVSGDEYYIILGANESVSPNTLDYSGKSIGITLLGYGGERIITLNANGCMFKINSCVSLTVDENITLVGRSQNSNCLISIYDGNLIINDGAIIKSNTTSTPGGGGIYMSSGNITMNGGKISGNSINDSGGGIGILSGTFIMNGGEISGNTACTSTSGFGGGVYVFGGNFIMNNGKISKNNAIKSGYSCSGGGVYVNGEFTMNGGVISGNSSGSGGGVCGEFTMNGGVINGNSSSTYGGGVNGTIKKIHPSDRQKSGIIYGSEAVGVDADGIELKNTSGNNRGHAVYSTTTKYRNTTVGETDQIDTTTGKGLSSNGNPPFGQ
jgi:hypothetical protein